MGGWFDAIQVYYASAPPPAELPPEIEQLLHNPLIKHVNYVGILRAHIKRERNSSPKTHR
jgi:hypothetical protein